MTVIRGLRLGGVLALTLLAVAVWTGAEARGDDADDIAAAIIRDTPNRAEAATKILNAARSLADSPGAQIRLCEKAYEQGMVAAAGYPVAIAALDLLEKISPTRAQGWRDKRLDAYRLLYYRSTGQAKKDTGQSYVTLLLALAGAAEKADNWTDAANHYSQAYTVARTLRMPSQADIYANVTRANSFKMLHNRISVLKGMLEKTPDDRSARKQIVMTYLVDLDRPGEAARYINDKLDPELRANATMAAKDASALTDANLFTLGLWYRSLAGAAVLKHTKARMLSRALDNLNMYVEVYTAQDAQRLRATTLVTLVQAELTALGVVAASRSGLPAGVILALSFDKGQWIRDARGGARIKDVADKSKSSAVRLASPATGKVGQRARVRKVGCVDTGLTVTGEPRTFAFWAKADSADSHTVMLFGAMSTGGRFYVGYDRERVLGIGMGSDKWRGEGKVKLDTAWHHYAVTWDGKTMGVYFDGTLRGTKAERTHPGGTVFVGAASSGSRAYYGLTGCIDEVAAFGRVLSQAEIQLLVKMGNEGKPLGT